MDFHSEIDKLIKDFENNLKQTDNIVAKYYVKGIILGLQIAKNRINDFTD